VEIFSAGDESRAARIESGFGVAASYASLVTEFLPLLQTIYGFMKEGKQVPNLADEDWDDMMFEEHLPEEPQISQEIDPNFVGPPPGQIYSGQSNVSQPPPQRKDGLTMESIMRNHMKKYGSTGLGKVKKELEKDGLTIDMEIKEDTSSADIYARYDKQGPSSDTPKLKNMTMKDLVERHQAQYGDEGMSKVMEEMDRAGLDNDGIEFEDEEGETVAAAQEVVHTDETEDQRQFFDDDDDADAKANFQDTREMAKIRQKLSDMPQISRDSLFDE